MVFLVFGEAGFGRVGLSAGALLIVLPRFYYLTHRISCA